MHEFALCQALVAEVQALARQHRARGVASVRLLVGPLSGTEPALLQSAFPLAVAGSALDGALLSIDAAPVRVACLSCGAESEAVPNRLVCGACGDWHTRILSGDEFDCVRFLRAGYDGLLLGGAVFNARLATGIIAAVRAGDLAAARRRQARMNDLMWRVYGGPGITCWLAGLKELLVLMGLFSTRNNLLGYELGKSDRKRIHAAFDGSDGRRFQADLAGGPIRPACRLERSAVG